MSILCSEESSSLMDELDDSSQLTEKEKIHVFDEVYGLDRYAIVSNHTVYQYPGSENFEHDDTGSWMNYSGVDDIVLSANAEHEGWQENYDY